MEVILFETRGYGQPFMTNATDYTMAPLDSQVVNTTAIQANLVAAGYDLTSAIVRLTTTATGNQNGEISSRTDCALFMSQILFFLISYVVISW